VLDRILAVGDGGLVLSSKTGGKGWGYVDLKLPTEVLSGLDFHGISTVGSHAWIAGRPGSVILHSADQGRNWEILKTGQPLPIHGLHFTDMRHGWAVGALGTILATSDGGKTWQVQQRGGQRAALLFAPAQGEQVPAETLARLGLEEGYIATGVSVLAPDPKSASPAQSLTAQRFAAAVRQAGGAAGDQLWQFPLPQHLRSASSEELLAHWNDLHGRRAADQMLRQLVLALRIWRPDVVVTDPADPKKAATTSGPLVAEALRQACKVAGDPQAFPEQLEVLGLKPCRIVRIFSLWPRRDQAEVVEDGNELLLSLRGTPRDFATPAAVLLSGDGTVLPPQRCFRLLETYFAGLAAPRQLMSDLEAKADHGGRRIMPDAEEVDPQLIKALKARRLLQALADSPIKGLTNADKLLAEMGRVLDKLPPDQGAQAAFALANGYVRSGQWVLAQEIYLAMIDRYPTHPLTAEAYRWLVRHNTSSEVRRRYELKQFVQVNVARVNPPRVPTAEEWKEVIKKQRDQQPKTNSPKTAAGQKKEPTTTSKEPGRLPLDLRDANGAPLVKGTSVSSDSQITYLSNQADLRLWQLGSLEFAKRLEGFGLLYARDPAVQFCLQSAHRQLGKFQEAHDWYRGFQNGASADSPWRAAAAAEVWLTTRDGPPPRPVQICHRTTTRPFLDGKFDDDCWQGIKPATLQNAVQDTTKDYHTEVRMAYDDDFLYVGLTCTHPPECHVPPAKERPRDANLEGFDRVSILLDLDRDYNTYFQLQVDQRGCVCEDCWGDRSWDPRWFVAVRSTKTAWNIEAAIPLRELTGQRVSLGTAWACNVVRVLPRRGVQAMSLPADVQPRPEGMGLLIFQDEPVRTRIRPASRQTGP
jgi:hypothetical protein